MAAPLIGSLAPRSCDEQTCARKSLRIQAPTKRQHRARTQLLQGASRSGESVSASIISPESARLVSRDDPMRPDIANQSQSAQASTLRGQSPHAQSSLVITCNRRRPISLAL